MDYSISIGIGKYLNLESTKYACEDAEEFHKIMQEVYDVKNRFILKNEKATVAQIQDMIQKVVKSMKEGDRLFFYFAGHGISFYDEPRLSCYDSLEDVSEWGRLAKANMKQNFTWEKIVGEYEELFLS